MLNPDERIYIQGEMYYITTIYGGREAPQKLELTRVKRAPEPTYATYGGVQIPMLASDPVATAFLASKYGHTVGHEVHKAMEAGNHENRMDRHKSIAEFDGDKIIKDAAGKNYLCVTRNGITRTLFTAEYAKRVKRVITVLPVPSGVGVGINHFGDLRATYCPGTTFFAWSAEKWGPEDHKKLLKKEAPLTTVTTDQGEYRFRATDEDFDGARIVKENPDAQYVCVTRNGASRTLFTKEYYDRLVRAGQGALVLCHGDTWGLRCSDGEPWLVKSVDSPFQGTLAGAWGPEKLAALLAYEVKNRTKTITVEYFE